MFLCTQTTPGLIQNLGTTRIERANQYHLIRKQRVTILYEATRDGGVRWDERSRSEIPKVKGVTGELSANKKPCFSIRPCGPGITAQMT